MPSHMGFHRAQGPVRNQGSQVQGPVRGQGSHVQGPVRDLSSVSEQVSYLVAFWKTKQRKESEISRWLHVSLNNSIK